MVPRNCSSIPPFLSSDSQNKLNAECDQGKLLVNVFLAKLEFYLNFI